MKTFIILLCYSIVIFSSSCKKEELPLNYPYEAIVIGENIDCKIYSIKITKDLTSVETVVGTTLDSIYIAYNLPNELKVSGLEIVLDLREPNSDESGVCTHLGPTYNWLTVTHAKKK